MPDEACRCPVCGDGDARIFLDRDNVAVHQNLLLASDDEARRIGRGRLQMRCCVRCGFVFNASFDESLMRYGAQYENAQHHSTAFQLHLDGLVDRLIEECGVTGKRIVEIGCGQGGFLRRLVEPLDRDNRGWGFDPAYTGPAEILDGRLRFVPGPYDEQAAGVACDVVLCRHVIEHVPEPLELLRAARRALAGSPHARVFFETPCVEWILDNQVLWDLFYEHCSLFSAESLALAFRLAGFRVHRVEHVFGGQYLWLEASPAETPDDRADVDARELYRAARAFGELESRQCAEWVERVRELADAGGVALWGAGAKGVTFANMVDPHARLFDFVVDMNPAKQGHFLAGTGHPIVAPDRLRGGGVRAAVALNPNYVDEIRATVEELGADVRVVDMMHEEAPSNA